MHVVHDAAPPVLKVFGKAEHELQALEPAVEYVPAGHVTQSVTLEAPGTIATPFVPAGHGVGVVWPAGQ